MTVRLSELDTIIFDLGEVIVDLDTDAVLKAFTELTRADGREIRDLIVSSPYLYQYETGQLADEEFVNEVNTLLRSQIGFADFRYAWNLMIKSIPMQRLNFMDKLKETHKILVLSNTNAMHEACFEEMVELQTGLKMRHFAHTVYYSHRIGLRKPESAIFELVIREQNLRPDRTAFLDDRPENIEAAKATGLQAIQVMHPDQIFEILQDE